ncbi:MAG: class I SAM-dependent methyltransferase [Candidatus Eisenbacteria bacterium]|uniref:Class I SAM-dependent methyltransferase n=1 Tax=Eiseniibacteriota bacterium TaxID=2212470 RepID=A0A933SER7_UNCEI|nr:class I SAM-dependent methyltransferase [Candidatus Eisenbacteria bacterium]
MSSLSSAPDPFIAFKAVQREGWSHFGPLAIFTTPAAARLVRFARITAGQRVLDVGSGTGVAAITAARLGAQVVGTDLTPELLEQAAENSRISHVDVEWRTADVEALPFGDAQFDVVISQFGHMFAPRPDVATAEMLRVLKPGGTIAFSTWPPDHFTGRMFALTARYAPPPPAGAASPVAWGEPSVVRERLGEAVRQLSFERDMMSINTLSPQHVRHFTEHTAGPVRKLVEALSGSDAAKLAAFRAEYDALAAEYFEMNQMRQSYLMTRAVKA